MPRVKLKPGINDLATTDPELAQLLVDSELATQLTRGSNKKVRWQCPNDGRHQWEAPVYRLSAGHGCPYCAGKKVLVGVNDLATLYPDVAARLVDPTEAIGCASSAGKKLDFKCDVCGNTYAKTVGDAVRARDTASKGCPYCAGKKVDPTFNSLRAKYPDLADELVDAALGDTIAPGSHKKVRWRCAEGHEWEDTPLHRIYGVGCPVCANRQVRIGVNDLATTHPDLAAQLAHPDDAFVIAGQSNKVYEWVCPDCGYHWNTTVAQRMKGCGCPVCAGKVVLPGVNDIATTQPALARELADPNVGHQVTQSSGKPVAWRCDKDPQHVWMATPGDRLHHGSGCPYCFATSQSSRMEQDLVDVVRLLCGDQSVLTNDRTILAPCELDIVVPDRHVAIEFNGCYWHSNARKSDTRVHENKFLQCRDAGYQLIQIWEDDWLKRRVAVIQLLAAKLGVTSKLPDVFPDMFADMPASVGARQCICERISGTQARKFLDANHIQGFANATMHLGLIDGDDELRAVMSLRDANLSSRTKRHEGEWDIQRYATAGSVRGGFTKLLKFAQQQIEAEGRPLTRWMSFSSNDVSDGALYERCGFIAEVRLHADYKYVGGLTGGVRVSKERFQKKRFRDDPNLLWEDGWTEREAALANKLYRVYDAGKIRWVKDV